MSFLTVALILAVPAVAEPAPGSVEIRRGPFLQAGSSTSMTIAFTTNERVRPYVRYGRQPGPPWEAEIRPSDYESFHAVALEGLWPHTRYYYEIEAAGEILATGRDYCFHTSPPSASRVPFRFAAWGDSGTPSQDLDTLVANVGGLEPRAELLLVLGDLVYSHGQADGFDPAVFTPLKDIIRNVVLWPVLGNHDIITGNGFPLLEAFHLPTDSGAPGHPSGTERYYSFDHGMVHFAGLDTAGGTSIILGSPQWRWLEADLDDARARGMRWIVVFTHKPPYTLGTHESPSEPDLEKIQVHLLPLLEDRGVDLFLAGHSHVYERSYLLKDGTILQTSADDYSKIGTPEGTVYVVTGAGARRGHGPMNHPLMAFGQDGVNGFSVFDVTYDEIHSYFLRHDGACVDLFTLRKEPDVVAPFIRSAGFAAGASSRIELVFNEPLQPGTGMGGAENPAHYALSGGVTVDSATLGSDQRTVVLETTGVAANTPYTVGVSGVLDRATVPNAVPPSCEVQVLSPSPAPIGETPVAHIDLTPTAANAPADVLFSSASSNDPDGMISQVLWHFGTAGSLTSAAAPMFTFWQSGSFLTTLVVTDDQGNRAIDTIPVLAHTVGLEPVAAATAEATGVSPRRELGFHASNSFDPDGGSLLVYWDFGDPASGRKNQSSDPDPKHVYKQEGMYTVTLTVIDDEGSRAVDTMVVTVAQGLSPPLPDSSGGGCFGVVGEGGSGGGDPLLVLFPLAALVLLALSARRRGALLTGPDTG